MINDGIECNDMNKDGRVDLNDNKLVIIIDSIIMIVNMNKICWI